MNTPAFRLNKVYITDFWTGFPDVEQEALGGQASVIVVGAHHERELLPHIADAAGLLVWHDIQITAATLANLPHCKVLVRIGVGYDNVDIEAAKRHNIAVCNVPDYGIEDVADHAIALLLALMRNLPQFHTDLRADPLLWDARRCRRTPRLRGQVLGIVGLGRIGSAVALRGKAFGLDVVAYDPYIPDGREKSLGIRRVDSLEELLRESDIVSLHTPLTPLTRDMMDRAALARMKPGALLINTARGPIVDTRAALRALEEGRLGGLALDVLPTEPPVADDPLVSAARDPQHVACHRCILTPHSAFYTEEGFVEMRRKAALEVGRALRGEMLRNRVNY